MQAVDLGAARNLLREWDEVRRHLLKGGVAGFALCLKCADGVETVYFGGDYQEDPDAALKVALSMSSAINQRTRSMTG